MIATLGELCKIQSGGTPSRSNKACWSGGNIPWAKISDINSKYLDKTEEFITEQGLGKSSAKIFPKGTILFTIFATLGEVAILNIDAATNQAIAGIQIQNYSIKTEYLYYYLSSLKTIVDKLGRGVAQNNINMSILKSLKIQVPSLKEQDKIVKTLTCIEKLIRIEQDKISKLDMLIKSRFIELFGDPVENDRKWTVKKLKDLSIKITNGNTPKGGSENYQDKGILFFRSQNVWRNRLDMSDIVYISSEIHQQMSNSSLQYKDILITKTGRINTSNSSLGRAALYLGEDDKANINGHVYLIRLNTVIIPEFVLSILTSEAYRDYIRQVCVGGIDKRQINLNHVEDFPIIMPPSELQNDFTFFKAQVDKSKLAVQKSLEELEILKKSLMQQYFG